jgi:tryptophan 2,3-dioxygenase
MDTALGEADRHFGEEGGRLSYGSYLRLPQLLDTLAPQSGHHDEPLFITVHQVYELWFRLLLHEVEGARDALFDSDLRRCRHLLHRVHAIERVLIEQIAVLETMTPQDFLAFRELLSPASGFQSVQFRELEFISGLKDADFAGRLRAASDEERARLSRRFAEPSLWDAYTAALARQGVEADLDGLVRIAVEPALGPLWDVAEDLLSHDENAALWRARHVTMVERQIGGKPGTGGSSGAPYLRGRLDVRYYPLLWDVRGRL